MGFWPSGRKRTARPRIRPRMWSSLAAQISSAGNCGGFSKWIQRMSRVLNVRVCPNAVAIVKLGSSSLPPRESPPLPITRSRIAASLFLAPQLVLRHDAPLHHPLHALELGDVPERISPDRDQVGVPAGLDGSDLALPADQ